MHNPKEIYYHFVQKLSRFFAVSNKFERGNVIMKVKDGFMFIFDTLMLVFLALYVIKQIKK
jgi:hypothetical protein